MSIVCANCLYRVFDDISDDTSEIVSVGKQRPFFFVVVNQCYRDVFLNIVKFYRAFQQLAEVEGGRGVVGKLGVV